MNLSKLLLARGFDPELFKPKLPEPVKAGRYVRTVEDARKAREDLEKYVSLIPRFQPPKEG